MALIHTTHGEMDDAQLVKREGIVDNAHERTTTVEYCRIGCDGAAHHTGIPAAPSHFCDRHVHRSVHVTLKEWPAGLSGETGAFT